MKASTKRLHQGTKSKNSQEEKHLMLCLFLHISQAGNCSPCERGEPLERMALLAGQVTSAVTLV